MKEAYKLSDGRKIEGRRILVDVERGRTVENWCVRLREGGAGGSGRPGAGVDPGGGRRRNGAA